MGGIGGRPNRFNQDSPADMAGLTTSDDVSSMVAIKQESNHLRTENLYFEGKIKEHEQTIETLSDELEKLVISEATLGVEKEQFRDDNRVLLEIIDQLNIELGELKNPPKPRPSLGSTGAQGPQGVQGMRGDMGLPQSPRSYGITN